MQNSLRLFLTFLWLMTSTTIVFGQLEFQQNQFPTNVSHPLASYAPPQMSLDAETDKRSGLLDARFQFIVDSMLFVHNTMGISAAITLPERGTWVGAGGFSDPVNGTLMDTGMLLEIDSNTKSFVASIILQMVDEGVLTLDDQLHQWLPSFPNVDSTITIRQILQHTGGVSDYLNDNPVTVNALLGNPGFAWTPEYIMTYVLAPNFPPGATWRYSNTGYVLAGMIIREVTGESLFATPLRQRLLTQHNLQHTYMDYEEPLPEELAHGWNDLNGDGILEDLSLFPRTSWASAAWTAGAIVATAEDLARWVELLHSNQVLSPAAMQQMRTRVPIPGSQLTYGLGIYTWPLFGKTLWGHDGGGIGYNSQALFYRERGVSIVVMMNQRGGTAWAGDYLAELFREVLKYYEQPDDHPFAIQADVSPRFIHPLTDSAVLSAEINNPDNRQVSVMAEYASSDSSILDMVELYDDGQHEDGAAGDNLYGNTLGPLPDVEAHYIVNFQTNDLDTAFTHLLPRKFTTIGPVEMETYKVIPLSADQFAIKFFLRNNGSITTAPDVSLKISSSDSNIASITVVNSDIGDLAAGQVDSSRYFYVNTVNQPSSVSMLLKIYSENTVYWEDSLSTVTITGVEPIAETVTQGFVLMQNYPNPFNPSTTIVFELPQANRVELKIFDMTGREVRTLMEGIASTGINQVIWDGRDHSGNAVSSGIYIYRLQTLDVVQSRKMLLIR